MSSLKVPALAAVCLVGSMLAGCTSIIVGGDNNAPISAQHPTLIHKDRHDTRSSTNRTTTDRHDQHHKAYSAQQRKAMDQKINDVAEDR